MSMDSSISTVGIGLLGASGLYHAIDEHERIALINAVFKTRCAQVDSADVYGDAIAGQRSTNQLIKFMVESELLDNVYLEKLINKIGAGIADSNSLDQLIATYTCSCKQFFQKKIYATLLHRPSASMLDRDKRFYRYFENNHRGELFGICTNSVDVLKIYSDTMNVQWLQVAVNIFDFEAALPVLTLAKKLGIHTQARSVLASGLLSGKFSQGDLFKFKDSIRSRFHSTIENQNIYSRRILIAENVKAFHQSLLTEKQYCGTLIDFCHRLILESPLIDTILMGGSSIAQIRQNIEGIAWPLPSEVATHAFVQKIPEWQVPYI